MENGERMEKKNERDQRADAPETEGIEPALENMETEDEQDRPGGEEPETAPARRDNGREEIIEPFVPSDYYQREAPRGKKKRGKRSRRRLVYAAILVLAGALLAVLGVYVYRVTAHPGSFFGSAATAPSPAPATVVAEAEGTSGGQATQAPSPTPTLDPYHQLLAGADQTLMQNIVNVLVIGVDYAEERETWNGKHAYHSDVMMVLAINFDENRVDLISLPRDTYANIPGVKGIYKLNASIDCGGGMDAADGAGFLKVCEAASWMLGGIPINYYYAVTMPAVKQLVDAVGGVDYDLEISFTMMGRRYRTGQQHMDGQGVLDYLRVRKNVSESGDWNRVNRQKKMMVALFESMQQQNLILKIPDIVNSFSGQLFTNCNTSQTAALASFAYGLDKESIGMYSMSGTMKNIFNWNFCITDQENRVKLIKTVYGIDVPEEKEYNMAYAQYRWAEMRAERYLDRCEGLTSHVRAAIEADDQLPEYQEPVYVDPGYGDGGFGGGDGGFVDGPIITAAPMGNAAGGYSIENAVNRFPIREMYRQYSEEDRNLYSSYRSALDQVEETRTYANKEVAKYLNGQSNSFKSASGAFAGAVNDLASLGASLADRFGYSISWKVSYEKDKSFNEITVDFN